MSESVAIAALKPGDTVSFNLYGVGSSSNILNATLMAIELGSGLRNPAQAAANHANLYSSLPISNSNPVPNNYTGYNYLLLKNPNGEFVEIGLPWIIPNTVTRLTRQTCTIVLHDFDSGQVSALASYLTVGGYINPTITLV